MYQIYTQYQFLTVWWFLWTILHILLYIRNIIQTRLLSYRYDTLNSVSISNQLKWFMWPRRSCTHWNRRRGRYKFANYYQNRFLISRTSVRHNDNYNRIKTEYFDWWIRVRTTNRKRRVFRKRLNEFEYVHVF